ncbi:MAG: hypothetical protein ACJAWV_000740 [Flammeovirgaceae bacterium]|jgi:hypothetical protein
MKDTRKLFHLISYLQYPLMAGSLFFYVPFLISIVKRNPDWNNLNNMLIFVGIAISFSALQDATKTQSKFAKRIWESPKKGKTMLFIMTITMFAFISVGLFGFYFTETEQLKSISIGLVAFGIGYIGLLKTAVEMFENHRIDRNPTISKSE